MTDAVHDSSPRVAPRRFGALRLFVFGAAERVTRALGGRALYRRRHLARGRFVVRREELPVAGLPAGLEGFTIAHVSDLHAGPFLSRGDLADVAAELRAHEPDVLAFTGDFITHTWEDAPPVLAELASVRARHGSFAVFGNHDYRGRQEGRIAEACAAEGIRVLRNECVRVDTGDGALAVVGIEDLEESKALDVAAARADLAPCDVEVVLCHNPLGARRLARPGCAAILSGHTHGGQMDLPFLRRLGPPHPGLRVRLGETTLIVNRGLGTVGVPLRVAAPTEVVLARLTRAGA